MSFDVIPMQLSFCLGFPTFNTPLFNVIFTYWSLSLSLPWGHRHYQHWRHRHTRHRRLYRYSVLLPKAWSNWWTSTNDKMLPQSKNDFTQMSTYNILSGVKPISWDRSINWVILLKSAFQLILIFLWPFIDTQTERLEQKVRYTTSCRGFFQIGCLAKGHSSKVVKAPHTSLKSQ